MKDNKKGSVLIAEDERSIRTLLRMYLESEGYDVREAADGVEALAEIGREAPDVMLLDLSMPPPQGMDVLRHIRQSGAAIKPAVVILTAYGSVKLAVEAVKLGALDFLEKPVSPEVLLETLARITKERELAKDPDADTYDVLLARVRVALSGGDLKLAEGLLLRAAPLGEKDAAFHNLLGLLKEMRGDFSGARGSYGKAMRLDKKYAPAQQNMRRLYELREFGQSNEPSAL
jgi:DNA-binding response OmpR family regulator